jgi:gamma-glutamyltranspeptidase/glutathione hydrolase
VLKIENRIDAKTGEALAGKGHKVEWWPEITRYAGAVCTIVHDRAKGRLTGGADPRRMSRAMGW